MKFIGIRRDKENENQEVKYELNIRLNDINCIYKDIYGVYIYTKFGRLYKVDHKLEELEKEVIVWV